MTDPLSKAAGHLLSCLPQDGKPVGNIVLRRRSELSEEKFENAREELISRGLALPGQGKGGALRRVVGKGRAFYAEFPVEPLAEPFSRAGKAELAERLKQAGDESRALEDQMWVLAYYLKPTLIAIGRDPVFQLDKHQFRPDVCAIFENSLLIADCKNTVHATYVTDWLDKVDFHRADIASVSRRFELEHVIYVCVVSDLQSIDVKVQERARKLAVKLIDARKVAYFVSMYRDAGVGVRDLFLGEVAPRTIKLEEAQVPALAVRVGGRREAFVFSMNAHLLLPRALVSHREVHDPESGVSGYQRMLSKGRLKAIAKHIEAHKSFPTPIVVVLHKNVRFDPGKSDQGTGRSRLGHLWLVGKPRTIQIVDGQHRLFGYSLVPWNEDHILHVIGYRESDDLDPATMFVDINSKQKPVSSGLMWELFPDIYGPEHPDHAKAAISVAVESSLGPLRKRIRHITTGSRGPITFAALCSEVLRAKFLTLGAAVGESADAQGKRLRQRLRVFFATLSKLESEFPKAVTYLLLRNVGIIAALRVYYRVLVFEGQMGGNAEILRGGPQLENITERYFRVLSQVYDSKDLTELEKLRAQRSSQGGYKRLFDDFVDVIEQHDGPGFGGPRPSRQVAGAVEGLIANVEDVNRRGISLGLTHSHVFKEFDASELTRIAKKELGIDSFEKLVKTLHQEIVEASGDRGPDNRLAKILGVADLSAIEVLKSLSLLRVYYSHKPSQIEPAKRKIAVSALQQLIGSPLLVDPTALTSVDFEKAACGLLEGICTEVLKPALWRMMSPPPAD